MNSHVSYNTFTQKIYNQVSIENDQNLVISPISLFMSLLICYAGSKGKSYNQLGKLLDISRQLDHQTFSYNHNFLSYTKQFSGQNLKLSLANKVYVQNGFKIEQNFLHTVNSMFAGSMHQLDFANSQQSAKVINDWVASRTNNKIKQAINPDSLSSATRLVLVNAIYFKANWALLFDEETTFKEDFFVNNGSKVKVPMMRIYDEYFKHLFRPANIDASTIEIPFSDRNFAMTIILPNQRFSLSHVERQLNAANVQKIISLNMIKEPMNIFIPKFSISSDLDLKKTVEKLGAESLFGRFANFSGISSKNGLLISDIVHKTSFEMDENGAEASGSTAINFGLYSEREFVHYQRINFVCNRPFMFVIHEKTYNNVLFIGKFVRP